MITYPIVCVMLFPFDARGAEFGKSFLALLHELAPDLVPVKYGPYEPTLKYSADGIPLLLEKHWHEGIAFNSKQRVSGSWHLSGDDSSLFLLDEKSALPPSIYLAVIKGLSTSWTYDFAYVHKHSDNEDKYYKSLDRGYHDLFKATVNGIGYWQIRDYLPELFWGTLFGLPYTELIGMERLLSAPAFKVEQWTDNGVYIQLTENICDVENNFEQFESVRQSVKAHLGRDLFFAPDRPRKDHRVPNFLFAWEPPPAGIDGIDPNKIFQKLQSDKLSEEKGKTAVSKGVGAKIKKLLESGIKLESEGDLLRTESSNYESLLCELAGENELRNVRHFDSECIYDSGDYTTLANKIVNCADGSLPIHEISDYLIPEQNEIIFRCKLNGKEFHWRLEQDEDWVDMRFFKLLSGLLQDGKKLAIHSLAQDFLIFCGKEEEIASMNKNLKLKFEVL